MQVPPTAGPAAATPAGTTGNVVASRLSRKSQNAVLVLGANIRCTSFSPLPVFLLSSANEGDNRHVGGQRYVVLLAPTPHTSNRLVVASGPQYPLNFQLNPNLQQASLQKRFLVRRSTSTASLAWPPLTLLSWFIHQRWPTMDHQCHHQPSSD